MTAFTFTNNTTAGAPVQFTTVLTDLINWDLGDGTTSLEINPSHVYANPGQYTVIRYGTDGDAQGIVNVVGATSTPSTLFMNLDLISDERYADIVIRDLKSSWPTKLYDNGAYPLRTIRVWPVPQEQYAVELWMWQPLATYDTLDKELNLPQGYERYLRFKFAVEIAPEFGKEVSESVKISLSEAEAAVKRMNQQTPVTSRSRLSAQMQHQANRVSQRGH